MVDSLSTDRTREICLERGVTFIEQPFLGYVEQKNYTVVRRTVGYASSYGCPHFCNFCAVVNLVGGRWRAQSAERVAGVFETYHRRWGVDAVELVDNNFFVDERRVADFSDRVKHLGMAWWGEGRVDTLLRYDDASLRAMRDAGLKMIFLGAESGSAETLERMDKGGRLVPGMTLELVEKLGELV